MHLKEILSKSPHSSSIRRRKEGKEILLGIIVLLKSLIVKFWSLIKMTEENQARKRKGTQQQPDKQNGNSDTNKKSDKQKPFQGRYNPKHSDKYGALSHKSLAKFVMLIGAVIFVVYSSYKKENIHTMAKVDEFLDKKRQYFYSFLLGIGN